MLDEKDLEQIRQLMNVQRDEILQQAARNTQVILENTVMKQLELLAEGQRTLLEMMAPKSRVETLEDEVVMLKQACRMMAQDIAELKKAQ